MIFLAVLRGASFQPRIFRSREGNLLATRFLQCIRRNLGLDKWFFNKSLKLNAQLIGIRLRLPLRKYRNKEFNVYLCVRILRYGIQCLSKPMSNSLDTIRASQHRTCKCRIRTPYLSNNNSNRNQSSRISCRKRLARLVRVLRGTLRCICRLGRPSHSIISALT